MKRISGYVIVKESGCGVPNVVVAAYDDNPAGKAFNVQLRETGRRIGSVLTDQDGHFVLTTEDLEFQGNESRPDLLVIVFAPEDVQRPDQPYALPPEQRILYISTVPRTEAGAEEAYIIRLLQQQIDKFHIALTSGGKTAASDSSSLAGAIQSSWRLQNELREKLKPRLLKEQAKVDSIRKIAEQKVSNLSAIPAHLRNGADGTNSLVSNRFLIKDNVDLTTNLSKVQDGAIAEGLARLQERRPALRLTLTSQDLEDLGLTESGTTISGTLDSKKLAEKVRSLMLGVDFVRVRGVNNPSPEELEEKYLSHT